MKHTKLLLVWSIVIIGFITSCQKKVPQDPNQLIEQNVRHYFSMGDSVELNIEIADTIFVDELTDMQENVIKNFNYAQADIDTLDHVIEFWQNKMFDLKDNGGSELDIKNAEVMMLSFELNQADTKLKQYGYKNSNRIFMNLQRSTVGQISGYELALEYKTPSDTNKLSLLIDASFRVLD